MSTRKITDKKITDNPNLLAFCNKILIYNSILEDEMPRNMFFVSLISSDNLVDEHSCDETIDTAEFILHNINLFVLNEEIKQKTIDYLKEAINIAERDKKEFINK
jgi:hypothetical protein